MLRFIHKPHLDAEKDHVAVVLVLAAFLNPPLQKHNFETPLVDGFRLKGGGYLPHHIQPRFIFDYHIVFEPGRDGTAATTHV